MSIVAYNNNPSPPGYITKELALAKLLATSTGSAILDLHMYLSKYEESDRKMILYYYNELIDHRPLSYIDNPMDTLDYTDKGFGYLRSNRLDSLRSKDGGQTWQDSAKTYQTTFQKLISVFGLNLYTEYQVTFPYQS